MHENRNNEPIARSARPSFRLRPEVTRITLVVLVFGLLLWARFILVTGHPRTAVADPPATPAHSQTAATHPSHAQQAQATPDARP